MDDRGLSLYLYDRSDNRCATYTINAVHFYQQCPIALTLVHLGVDLSDDDVDRS